MQRRTVSGITLTLLLIGMLTLTFCIQTVKAKPRTITVPDDYPTIQEAVNAANEGDIVFVRIGTYYEHVVVNKTVSLVGEDVSAAIVDGDDTGHVVEVVSNNVNITGFTLQNSGNIHWPDFNAGICLDGTTNCTISENRLVGNGFAGISLIDSERCTITDNNVAGTSWGGVHLANSSNSTVSGNILDSNIYTGINGHAYHTTMILWTTLSQTARTACFSITRNTTTSAEITYRILRSKAYGSKTKWTTTL